VVDKSVKNFMHELKMIKIIDYLLWRYRLLLQLQLMLLLKYEVEGKRRLKNATMWQVLHFVHVKYCSIDQINAL
jgi:hypothetical protein